MHPYHVSSCIHIKCAYYGFLSKKAFHETLFGWLCPTILQGLAWHRCLPAKAHHNCLYKWIIYVSGLRSYGHAQPHSHTNSDTLITFQFLLQNITFRQPWICCKECIKIVFLFLWKRLLFSLHCRLPKISLSWIHVEMNSVILRSIARQM